jgi:hypothetical protein
MAPWIIGIVVGLALAVISAAWRKSRDRAVHVIRLRWTPWGKALARQALAIDDNAKELARLALAVERCAADRSTDSSLQSMNWNPSDKLRQAFYDYYTGRDECPTMEQVTAWYDEQFPAPWKRG